MHPALAPLPAPRAAAAIARVAGTRGLGGLAVHALSSALLLALATSAHAAPPSGGVVSSGAATIQQAGPSTVVTQTTQHVSINWQDFGIGAGESVQFVQPGADAIALNRVLGANPSVVLGSLTANGRVFLLNPNGVLFGQGSSVNVGGLVASTMSLGDADFQAGRHAFTGAGTGAVVNEGSITAGDGGYVALMGTTVRNTGVIVARLGTVALAAGEAVTLDVAGDGLLNVAVSTGAVDALAENGGLIRADGGRVLMTAQAAGDLLHTTVNNTGVIQARTIATRRGSILLLGDLASGTVDVGGTLDASAPGGGDGGGITTSAATVTIGAGAVVTTQGPTGQPGTWTIGSQDFTIGSAPGDNIAGATLSAQLVTGNIAISTTGTGVGNGDIVVDDALEWSASGGPTTLTLTAARNVDIHAAITATNGNLEVCCGQDVNVDGAITTTNGSVLLAAGRDVNQNADITVTDGNLMMCAANDVNVGAAITLTRGTNDPTRSLGLPRGLTLSADTDGTGPGIAGGTVVFDPLAPPATVTAAPVNIYYNPVSYTAPTDYATQFTLTEGAALRQYMLVFAAGGDRPYDGTTATTLTGLQGNPAGVTLVAGPGARADFDRPDVGNGRGITFTGYTLGGPDAGAYALPVNCCGTIVASTTGNITPQAPPPPPPPPPPETPPETPPPETPPETPPPPPETPPETPPAPPEVPPPTTPEAPPGSPPTSPPDGPRHPPTPETERPPAGRPIFLTPRRTALPPTPEAPIDDTPDALRPQVLVVTPTQDEAPAYVPPVRAPKPYRN